MSAKATRPSSAVVRADTDHLSVLSHRQQNGSVTVGRQTAGGVSDSVGGLRRAVLYVLGEKNQMKVIGRIARPCNDLLMLWCIRNFLRYYCCTIIELRYHQQHVEYFSSLSLSSALLCGPGSLLN